MSRRDLEVAAAVMGFVAAAIWLYTTVKRS
jgi:hypothetical protein